MSLAAATREEVARLLGRAAFGATASDLATWTGRPYTDLVDHLTNFPDRANRSAAPDDGQRQVIQQSGHGQTNYNAHIETAQEWWLERMRTTQYPLEERMTLFWHGHFATGPGDPYPDMAQLMAQNEMLRQNALGNFRQLVAAVTLDPAMLEWLDGAGNTIPKPNENYARELMELFTLGKYPQIYGEDDVREAARVLTGWTVDGLFQTASFHAPLHDAGAKTVLGATITNQGANEYRQLIDVLLSQPISPRFIAYKLVANFGYATSTDNLSTAADPLVARVAQTFRSSDWNIREAVRTILLSDEFRTDDPAARRQLVRQPAEVIVAAAKALNFSLNNSTATGSLQAMGQSLFVPPNVGGWPIGTAWLSPSTVLARYGWGVSVQSLAGNAALPPSSDLDAWARLFGMAPLTSVTTEALHGFLEAQGNVAESARQASLVVLMLSTPEWTVL